MAREQGSITRMPLRVRYHECDPQGVVFNANYLSYADMASFECIKTLFGSHERLREREIDMVVAESTVRYLSPCGFDDELVVDVFAQRVGTTSLVLRFGIQREQEPVAEVTNRYVWVSAHTLRPTPPPEDVRDAFAQFAPTDRAPAPPGETRDSSAVNQ